MCFVDAIIPLPQKTQIVNNIPRDPHWCAAPVAAGALRRWLTDRGSLTARLERHAGPIKVKVLFQGLRRVNRDEAFLFESPVSRVLVREVLLLRGTKPLVFAHTVVAPGSLRGAWRSVTALGTRPLGAALFADPRIARFPLRQKKLPLSHPLHRRAAAQLKKQAPPLWARRSIFAAGDSPILVSEVFLPALYDL
jgi:chorismate--pyruvate lyase